jgi:hypothetical protein
MPAMTDQTLLILDTHGIVRCCSDPGLFGGDADQLHGKPLVSLIPTLLLRENAPDHNLAYAKSWWANGSWHCHTLHTLDERWVNLEICLRTLMLEHVHYLLAILQRAPPPVKGAPEARRIFQSATTWAIVRLAAKVRVGHGAARTSFARYSISRGKASVLHRVRKR